MPKKARRQKARKKSTTTKQFKQLQGEELQKYTANVKKCQTKSPKFKLQKDLKLAEIAKKTFYIDNKKLLKNSKGCLKTKNGTGKKCFKICQKLPTSAKKC